MPETLAALPVALSCLAGHRRHSRGRAAGRVATARAGEDDVGRTVMVTATLDGAARAAAREVALAVTGGTAEAVTDFSAVTGVTVTIPAQQLAGTETFRFSLVTDDDVPSTAISLSVAPATVRESASATRLTVTAELDASPEAAATEVTLSLAGLTAMSGTDFLAVDPVTLTLPAGQVRATAQITLTPVRDAIDEGDGETVRIGAVNATSGSALLLNPSSLEVTIADDDTRGITLSRSALTVREEGSTTWTVRLKSAPEGGDVTVTPTVTGNPDVTVAPASRTFTAADWSRAQTVGGRHDGGDAETGLGVDIGGGVALAMPARGLTLSLDGRGLLSHAESGFRDRGFSGQIAWDPKPVSDRGLSLSLRQTVGGSATGGAQALFSREVMDDLGADDNGSAGQLEAKLGYGFPVFEEHFTGTPEFGFALSGTGRGYSLGWRLTTAGAGSLEFSVDARRLESLKDNRPPEHGIGLRLSMRW